MMNNTVYIVLRTILQTSVEQDRSVEALPIIDGVFASRKAAQDFVDHFLDDVYSSIKWSIIVEVVR